MTGPAGDLMAPLDLVVQLNASWRVMLDRQKNRAWWFQHLTVDGTWSDKAMIRSAEILRGHVLRYAGAVDAPAKVILRALPAVSHLRDKTAPVPKPPAADRAQARKAAAGGEQSREAGSRGGQLHDVARRAKRNAPRGAGRVAMLGHALGQPLPLW
jgi:hypothetical protein